LRERKEDIPNLIEFFMDKYRTRLSKNVRLSNDAADVLLTYDYPGNVRELENTIERCVTLAACAMVGPDELPVAVMNRQQAAGSLLLADVAADAEKNHILGVLKTTQGNKTRAAGILGISRKTLWEKMNAYGIR
jgi:two-component system response regulator AtoC